MAVEAPGDDDRLEAIRSHADRSMRYYVTAFLRENEENRDLMRAYMSITANFLALLDRDSLDDHSMMSGREEIIQQYLEQARSDPYEPGNCSFCDQRPVVAWFEGPSFRTFVRTRLKYGRRRRGWRAGRASRSWRRTIAKALPCEARGDPEGGPAREPTRSSAICKTSTSGDTVIRREGAIPRGHQPAV